MIEGVELVDSKYEVPISITEYKWVEYDGSLMQLEANLPLLKQAFGGVDIQYREDHAYDPIQQRMRHRLTAWQKTMECEKPSYADIVAPSISGLWVERNGVEVLM